MDACKRERCPRKRASACMSTSSRRREGLHKCAKQLPRCKCGSNHMKHMQACESYSMGLTLAWARETAQ
eukprot:982474-Alexandrium_andersonii.AAC.1